MSEIHLDFGVVHLIPPTAKQPWHGLCGECFFQGLRSTDARMRRVSEVAVAQSSGPLAEGAPRTLRLAEMQHGTAQAGAGEQRAEHQRQSGRQACGLLPGDEQPTDPGEQTEAGAGSGGEEDDGEGGMHVSGSARGRASAAAG